MGLASLRRHSLSRLQRRSSALSAARIHFSGRYSSTTALHRGHVTSIPCTSAPYRAFATVLPQQGHFIRSSSSFVRVFLSFSSPDTVIQYTPLPPPGGRFGGEKGIRTLARPCPPASLARKSLHPLGISPGSLVYSLVYKLFYTKLCKSTECLCILPSPPPPSRPRFSAMGGSRFGSRGRPTTAERP